MFIVYVQGKVWVHTETSTITDKSSPTALLFEACQYLITQCSNYNVKMFRSEGIMHCLQVNCKVWVHTETSTITDKSSPTALLCEACQYFVTQCSNYNVKMFRSKGIMFIVYIQANCKVWVHTETSTITDKSSPTALLCEAYQYFITQCSNDDVKMFRSKGIMFIVYVQVNCKVWVHTETSTITDKSSPTALLCEACQYFITQCSNYNVKMFRSKGYHVHCLRSSQL